ncbi:unnamed protein product [Lupinus luteus]|uniref:Uncharacterized protein n=1 Tax=Lupinus luteus TaxID=3873 RepID=A0AAV1Y792_LUPLU
MFDAVIFFGLSLALGIARRTRIPYTVALGSLATSWPIILGMEYWKPLLGSRFVFIVIEKLGVATAIINESLVEGEEVRRFLEDVCITYPQLEKVGILEEKEILHLHNAVHGLEDVCVKASLQITKTSFWTSPT